MSSRFGRVYEIIDRTKTDAEIAGAAYPFKECDCACSVSWSPSSAVMQDVSVTDEATYRRAPELFLKPLTGEHWAAFDFTGGAGVVTLNQPAYALLRRFESPQPAAVVLDQSPGENAQIEHAIAELLRLNLLQGPQEETRPATNGKELLTAWIHLTNRCNLDCAYCYLQRTNEDMSAATARRGVDAVIRSVLAEGYPTVKLKYSGGEPLLRLGAVFRVHDYARTQCQSHGIELQAVMLSNGTLLTEKGVEGLKARNVNVTVSLDGLGHTHDVQRPYRSGGNSAQDVVSGIERLLEGGLLPHLSVTITQYNCKQIDDVVRFALNHGLTFSLNLYRETDHSMPFPDLQSDEGPIVAGLCVAFRALEENLPRWSIVGTILDRGHLLFPHEHPCGVGQDYIVINHKGHITKCHMQMDKCIADIQHHNLLEPIRHSYGGPQNLSSLEKEGCRDCEWRLWCAGGCPITTFRATGRYDVKSPYCDIYKAIFPEAVRLEALRLLKYARRSAAA